MSVRIHQLAKQIKMENKELLELLRGRGFEVKSVSSTIDNISAESIVEEFSSDKKNDETSEQTEAVAIEVPEEAKKPNAPVFPEGAIVKSAEEIKQEREALVKTNNSENVSPYGPLLEKDEIDIILLLKSGSNMPIYSRNIVPKRN